MKHYKFYIIWCVISILWIIQPLLAQEESTCENTISSAIETTQTRCEGLDHNDACYGFGNIKIAYQAGHPLLERPDRLRFLPDGPFIPSDAIRGIQTSELNTHSEKWGLAILNIQDELTEEKPVITYIIQGDTHLTDMSASVSIRPTCEATAIRNRMNVREGTSTNTPVVGTLDYLASAPVLGRLEDNSWWLAELPEENTEGWLFGDLIEVSCSPKDVPIYSPEGIIIEPLAGYRPLQAFMLETNPTPPECTEQPPANVIAQSSGPVSIWVNQSTIALNGTVALRTDAKNALIVESLEGWTQVEQNDIAHMAIPGTFVRVPTVTELEAATQNDIDTDTPEATTEIEKHQPVPQVAQTYELDQVANVPIQLLPQNLTIPNPHDVTVLRNPETVSNILQPKQHLLYALDAEAGYYLTLYFGSQEKTPAGEDEETSKAEITLVSPMGYVIELPSGPTLGIVDQRFAQRLPIWLREGGTYYIYLEANNQKPIPFFLHVQGHRRNFCNRIIERTAGHNTFTLSYPFWGEVGQTVHIEVTTELRHDPDKPTLAIYDSIPAKGELLVQSDIALSVSEGEPIDFEVPRNSAYFVEVQVKPSSNFRLETTCK